MAAVATAFGVTLTAGYQVHQYFPSISDQALGITAGIAIGVIALAITMVTLRLPWGFRRRIGTPVRRASAPVRNELAAYREYRERRIAQLAADPATQKYAELMKYGRDWSDDQIAYDRNPSLTATCPHLKPIEHAMRTAGIAARLQTRSWKENYAPLAVIEADCRVNQAGLRRAFALPEFVSYVEGYSPERSQFDNPFARLLCTGCQSAIELVHPEWPRPATRWFPS